MSFIELLTFVITMIAFFALMIKQSKAKRSQESLIDDEEEVSIPLPSHHKKRIPNQIKPKVPLPSKKKKKKDEPILQEELTPIKTKFSPFFNPHAKDTLPREVKHPLKKILHHKLSLQDAILLKEIMGPPKSLQ